MMMMMQNTKCTKTLKSYAFKDNRITVPFKCMHFKIDFDRSD